MTSCKTVSWCGRRRRGLEIVEVMEVALRQIKERRRQRNYEEGMTRLGGWGRQNGGDSNGVVVSQSALVDDQMMG